MSAVCLALRAILQAWGMVEAMATVVGVTVGIWPCARHSKHARCIPEVHPIAIDGAGAVAIRDVKVGSLHESFKHDCTKTLP